MDDGHVFAAAEAQVTEPLAAKPDLREDHVPAMRAGDVLMIHLQLPLAGMLKIFSLPHCASLFAPNYN